MVFVVFVTANLDKSMLTDTFFQWRGFRIACSQIIRQFFDSECYCIRYQLGDI